MATPIQVKVQQMRNANFDLGNQITNEVECGYGGKMQEFEHATIYYHPVMNNEAHEVHGGIRTKYLSMGGHDINASARQRLFGFPLSDEENSADGSVKVSRFEWGAIYWTNGGVAIYGPTYTEYRVGDNEKNYGFPLADTLFIRDGQATFFKNRVMYSATKGTWLGTILGVRVISIGFKFPLLGRPWLTDKSALPKEDVIRFNLPKGILNENMIGNILEAVFNGRIFLRETGGTPESPLAFKLSDAKQSPLSEHVVTFTSRIRLVENVQLKNNQLYDVILKFPGRVHVIAPHSIYIRESWSTFKFIHLTDLHISRRLDKFRKFFRDRTMDDAVRNFNNFNDNFREFIQYANRLHEQGNLDFIMITGDLVDYVFEDGGKTNSNNNFVYFENIVRGLTGKPDLVENDELKVPIFTSLGNHDYRTRPYYPIFRVDIQWPAENRTMEQFGSMNLTKDEATVVTEDLLNIKGMISSETAVSMIRPDRENNGGNLNYYFNNICDKNSYVVALGDHKLIMIDGKWDDGTIEGTWDGIKYYLGLKGEASDNFVGGSPDSVGFIGAEFDMVSKALQDKDSLVIIGVHNPLINVKHSEYPYFIRKSLRSANPQPYVQEMSKFLFRTDPSSFVKSTNTFQVLVDLTQEDVHKSWTRKRVSHFHVGNGDDLLDYGIMRGNGREDFLKLCTGVKNSPRPADLILSGHVHKNWECSAIWMDSAQAFIFSHDFYTENPSTYYHSYDTDVVADRQFVTPLLRGNYNYSVEKLVEDKQIRIHVQVTDDAGDNEKPTRGSSGVWSIKTKPNPHTLNKIINQSVRKSWWDSVRPLLVQTAALGPSEYLRAPERQPDFRGCRLISVTDNAINKIEYVKQAEIKQNVRDLSVNSVTALSR